MAISQSQSRSPLLKPANTKAKPRPVGPIEIEMRKKLSRLVGTRYPDQFDWSVYDKISERFGDEQPRGGVVFKTSLKLVNYHTSCSKCHYAFEVDSYGRGCVHNCIYCYAKDQLTTHGYWNRPMPFPVDLSEIRKIFYTVFETDKKSKWREILENRIPLRIGSMSDSFMWLDRKYKVTQELLRILKFYRYPYIVFTRSDLVATDEYMALIDRDLASIQFSICGNNENLTKIIEPGAPSVARRFNALRILNENKFWTTVRLNPLFPIYPDGYFTDKNSVIERFGSLEAAPKFEFFDWDFVQQIAETGTPSFLAGFVRLSTWAINNLSRATGIDIKSFFKPENLQGHGDKRYSDSEIAYYYTQLKFLATKNKLRFNTCYIGNGEKDYYQYQKLWDNKKDCCDAVGNVKAFSTTSQRVDWQTRIQHSPCKDIAFKAQAQEKEYDELYAQKEKPQKIERFKNQGFEAQA